MKIAYLNKKSEDQTEDRKSLEIWYLRDIRKLWVKNKAKYEALGVTEEQFFKEMKSRVR